MSNSFRDAESALEYRRVRARRHWLKRKQALLNEERRLTDEELALLYALASEREPFAMSGRNIQGSSRRGYPPRTERVAGDHPPYLPRPQQTVSASCPFPRLASVMRRLGTGIRAGIERIWPCGRSPAGTRGAPGHLKEPTHTAPSPLSALEERPPFGGQAHQPSPGGDRSQAPGTSQECSSCPLCGAARR